MMVLETRKLGKKFKSAAQWAVRDFDLRVEQGEIVALLGESGCGKTTVLRMIAGFETPSQGEILINGEPVAAPGLWTEPQDRRVGIVFQDYALFPHKTVWENIGFGLFRLGKAQASLQAREIIALTGLEGLEQRYPHQLSGGQKQRVALARAMAPRPQLILFDEPFSNIDTMRKNQMREDIREIIKKSGATAVFVTHDTRDVLAIADKVCLMRQGQALQTDTPDQVYRFPYNTYVADFFGKTNLLQARITQEGYLTPMGMIYASLPQEQIGDQVMVSIRPEAMELSTQAEGCFCGNIKEERFFGEYKEIVCQVKTTTGESQEITIYTSPSADCPGFTCYFKPRQHSISIIQTD